MTTTLQEKLFTLYQFTSEQLTDFFKSGNFDKFSIRINEFQVFCAFWVTTCYLSSTSNPAESEVETFNKSIIISIIDAILEKHPADLEEDKQQAVNDTVTNVFVGRFSSYRELFRDDIDTQKNDGALHFPRLVESFLENILDKPVKESSPIRHLLDSGLTELLQKTKSFFNFCR